MIEIAYLNDHPTLVPGLAERHAEEWQHLYAGWDAATAATEFAAQHSDGSVPTTLIALEDGELRGSVSLIHDDLPGWEQLNPWLASLYVLPAYRKLGIASRLVAAVDELLVARGCDCAYLFTEARESFFTRRGWHAFAITTVLRSRVAIMAKTYTR
ncbi:MAG: GNAT family N-acetyltransferase [Gammaproteobacteria bacterium]|nr:GNAT family N-acetyltransferase [Gammaproteobacteria bacterium]